MKREAVTLDQCLFGYDDGHRMLVSSMPLGDEASTLTGLSDLAPGTVFGESDGYWTGLPVPEIGRYALMRTWPAPEMPRPGCVWTHALLLTPADFDLLDDLEAVRASASRPSGPGDRERYGTPLGIAARTPSGPARDFNQAAIEDVLLALYADEPPRIQISKPGELDDAVFAAWSQQWPRLRRNLRFQTAAVRGMRPGSGPRFDVTAQLEPKNAPTGGSAGAWLSEATEDARRGPGAPLRAFLRRFGGDVRRQRGSFRPLVEVFLMEEANVGEAVSPGLLAIVTGSFPEPGDALRLKQDIVDGALLPAAQLDVLRFLQSGGGGETLPPPSSEGVARLAQLWPDRPDELLHLAEAAAASDGDLDRSIFETVTGAIPTGSFWTLTIPYPQVRHRMLEARPALLATEGALSLDNATLVELLDTALVNHEIVMWLLPRLLARDDDRLAYVLLNRQPRTVATCLVEAANGGSVPIGRGWMRALVRRPDLILDSAVMGRINRTSLLFEVAETLGWLSPAVVSAGTEPWIAPLVAGVASDLSDDRRDTFRAFLVALALASGGDGGRRMLEKFFDAVHHEILKSRLPWRAKDLLSPLLPDLGWTRWWDFGLRLRLAVAAAYVRGGYPTESYANLARSRKVRVMLAEAAAEIDGGRPYAKAARG